MKLLLIFSLAISLASFDVLAQEDDDASSPGPEDCPKTQASTIFVKD